MTKQVARRCCGLWLLALATSACGETQPVAQTPEDVTSASVGLHQADSATALVDIPPVPKVVPDTTPPAVAFTLAAPAATRPHPSNSGPSGSPVIPILVGDSGVGLKEVRLRWLGLLPGTRIADHVVSYDAPLPKARLLQVPWPPLGAYVLAEVTATDGAGNAATDRRWLSPQLPLSVTPKTPADTHAVPKKPPRERRWKLELTDRLFASDALKTWLKPALSQLNLRRFLPKALGSGLGHSLSLVRFVHNAPTLSLELIESGLAVTFGLSAFTANVDIDGLIQRRVTARGALKVNASFFGLLNAGELTLRPLLVNAHLTNFDVNVPGATTLVAKQIRKRIVGQTHRRVRRLLKEHGKFINDQLSRVHHLPLAAWGGPVFGEAAVLKRRLSVQRGSIRSSEVTLEGELSTPAGDADSPMASPRRVIFAVCPPVADTKPQPSNEPAPPPPPPPASPNERPHITLNFHVEQLLGAVDQLFAHLRDAGPLSLTLPFASMTLQAPLPPLVLGCVAPSSGALWFQVAGIRVGGTLGSGLLSTTLDAEVGATLKVEFRTYAGRLQTRVEVVWLWTSLGILGDLIARQLTPWNTWRDVPATALPPLTSNGKLAPVTLRAASLRIDGRDVTVTFNLAEATTATDKENQ